MPRRESYTVKRKTTAFEGRSIIFEPVKKGKYNPSIFVPIANFRRFLLFSNVKRR